MRPIAPLTDDALAALGDGRLAALWRLLRDCPLAAVALDGARHVMFWNAAAQRLFGWREAETLGRPSPVVHGPTEAALQRLVGQVSRTGRGRLARLVARHRDGRPLAVRVAVMALRETGDGIAGAIALFTPAPTGRQGQETAAAHDIAAPRDAERLLEQLLASTSLAVIAWDADQRVRRWSSQATAIFGWEAGEALGKPLADLGLVHPEDRRPVALALQSLIDGATRHTVVEQRNLTKQGLVRTCRWHSSIAERAVGCDFVVLSLIEDVTEDRAAGERVRQLAEHDALTQLPNRALLMDRLRQTLAHSRRHESVGALLLLDLDRFKEINDTLGHGIGDRMLVETAARLRATVRESDTVARLGGDEFALVLPELESAAAADLVATKVLAAIADPMWLEGENLRSAASIGIALFPDHGTAPERLLECADLALYHGKAQGGGAHVFYAPGMDRRAQARRSLLEELHQAVADGAFEVRYQPQIALAGGAVVGLEALLRWHHPERGLVLPSAFLEPAESSGLIRQIGRLVLRSACAQALRWRAGGLGVPRIAINLSPAECRASELGTQVARILERARLPRHLFEVEVGERALAARSEPWPPGVTALAEAGIGLALDDFGRHAASLTSLLAPRLTRVKLARPLIEASLDDEASRLIIEAIVDFAHRLGVTVLATGVETRAQRRLLERLGCDEAQGYLFAPALSGDDVAALLAAR